jgi:LysM repeat protein
MMAIAGNGHIQHRVRAGETLAGIAHSHGLDWQAIARLNHITDPRRLPVGATLRLPPHGRRGPVTGAGVGPAVPHAPLPPAQRLPAAPSPAPIHQPGASRLGHLSMVYETGYRPGQEAQAAAVVSSGRRDPGGVSYGAYQLASSAKGGRQVQAFLRGDGARWAARFGYENPALPRGAFGQTWKAIAAEAPIVFFEAQHDYIARTHFNPVVSYVRNVTQVDLTSCSRTVQNVVWSMGVQHGRAPKLVAQAVQQVGPLPEGHRGDYERDLINTLHDIREAYVDKIGLGGLKDRYRSERQAALRQLG